MGTGRKQILKADSQRENSLLPGPQQLSFDIEECFMKSIPSQFEASQKAMKMLREKSPGRKIV
jgi:hypothetical protein